MELSRRGDFLPRRFLSHHFRDQVPYPGSRRALSAAIATFHPLTDQEAAQAQPLHLRLAVAGPGETADTMATKMAIADRPLDISCC